MSRMGAESCRFSSRMDGIRKENRKQIRKANLPTGIDDFQKIRTNNYYYEDKTAVIEQVLENGSEVTLFTRPRRFGKSLNMSMMQCFFEAGADASFFVFLFKILLFYFLLLRFLHIPHIVRFHMYLENENVGFCRFSHSV